MKNDNDKLDDLELEIVDLEEPEEEPAETNADEAAAEEIEEAEEEIPIEEEEDLVMIDLDEEGMRTVQAAGRQAGEAGKAESSVKKEVISTVLYMAFVMCIVLLFLKFVAQRTCVNGDSMNDTLQSGDNLMVDKLSYRFKDPERFDIIVFPYEHQENTYYIKRIIGLPGETVQVQDGKIYINGEVLDEPYGKEEMDHPGIAVEPIRLADDEYFVLGDNRNNSSDSRDPSVGNIHRDKIVGKAFIRIWPLSEFGLLKHQ